MGEAIITCVELLLSFIVGSRPTNIGGVSWTSSTIKIISNPAMFLESTRLSVYISYKTTIFLTNWVAYN